MKAGSTKPMADRLSRYSISASGCWEWMGSKDRDGYGRMIGSTNGIRNFQFAHRASFEHHVNPIPFGKQILHHCDNPCCINPDHLYIGDPAQNGLDKKNRGRAVSIPCFGAENPMYGKTGALNPFFGKKHSEETKAKIGNANRKKVE